MSSCAERRSQGVDSTDPLQFDEVLAAGVKYLHIERQSDGEFWMGIDLEDGRHYRVNLWTKRGAIYARMEEDT